MEKRTYYISVETGQILEDKEAASYEFEVEATEEEINQLREIFDQKYKKNVETFVDIHFPHLFDEVGGDVQNYNKQLLHVYQNIYQLGTNATRKQIKESDILNKLSKHTDTYDFG